MDPGTGGTIGIGAIQENANRFAGRNVTVEGQVVRTSRHSAPTGVATRFLVRDGRGDTISVSGAQAVPRVGSRVRMSGLVEVEAGEPTIVVAAAAPPGFEVLGEAGVQEIPSGGPRMREGIAAAGPDCEGGYGFGIAGGCGEFPGRGWLPIGIGLALLAAGGVVLARRRRTVKDTSIPLIIDLYAPPAHADPNGRWQEVPRSDGLLPEPVDVQPLPDTRLRTAAAAAMPAAVADPSRFPAVVSGFRDAPAVDGADDPRPDEADTLQLLPGRLEVVQGEGVGPELRFFRIGSREMPEITFGRSDGPGHRHVQLPAPSVSRMHARLRFQQRGWSIQNLSRVNPLSLNGEEVGDTQQEHELSDGDEIRIGDFIFRYRATVS